MEKWDIDDLRCRMLGLESLVYSAWRAFDEVVPQRECYEDYDTALSGLYAIYQYLNDLNTASVKTQEEMAKEMASHSTVKQA